MRGSLIAVILVVIGGSQAWAQSDEIATCRNPAGHTYYHFNGLAGKASSGWIQDKTGNGVTLLRAADGTFDLLVANIHGRPTSIIGEGAWIKVLRLASDQVTLLVYYEEGDATEIYSFFKEKDSANRYSVLTNKTGDAAKYPRSGVMVGTCDTIRFDLLDKK